MVISPIITIFGTIGVLVHIIRYGVRKAAMIAEAAIYASIITIGIVPYIDREYVHNEWLSGAFAYFWAQSGKNNVNNLIDIWKRGFSR